MKIGYIVNDGLPVEWLDNVGQPLDDKPTLIVGWKKAKEMYPEMSLRNWQISDKIYWTLESSEDRFKMEKDISIFKQKCIEFQVEKFKIEYFDLMLKDPSELIFSENSIVLSSSNNLYIRDVGRITYLSLSLCNLLDFDVITYIKNKDIRIIDYVDNIFNVDDKYLLCFYST